MTGPSLADLWGRKAGSLPSFNRYSAALKSANVTWDDKTLNKWIKDPQHLVPGNEMTFDGIKDDRQRADLLAFLKQATQPGASVAHQGGSMGGMGGSGGGMGGMMGGGRVPNLKHLDPEDRVQAISYCKDTYTVTTANGQTRKFWERNLRLKTDASADLVEAQNPVIVCDRVARTPAGMARLVELAETLQCGVIDNIGRMNFPSRHPLNQSFRRAIIAQADVILAIEMNDLWGTLTHFSDRIVRQSRPATKPGAKIITLGVRDLYLKSNYQDFGRWQDVDLDIAGDGEASLPGLQLTGFARRCAGQQEVWPFHGRLRR
jgi:hypothetical protein